MISVIAARTRTPIVNIIQTGPVVAMIRATAEAAMALWGQSRVVQAVLCSEAR